LNTFATQQQIFAEAKRIYRCIYNGVPDYIRLVTAISRQLWAILSS